MDIKMLDEKKHIDMETGCMCRYVQSNTEYFRPHYHNYYELFMVMRGKVCHVINSKEQLLHEGQLLFIRDFDVHDYKSADGEYFEFVNLAFSKKTLLSLCDYLGAGFPSDILLATQQPPAVSLTEKEKEKLFFSFMDITADSDKEQIKLRARTLILNVFTKYFMNYSEKEADVPLWLEITYEKMKKPQNFISGTQRMYEISGKSREHLSRCLKQYYDITPTELVSELRLSHASNLLVTSNLSVTDICYECGFENLSWFYKIFEERFGITPARYRRNML